MTKQATTGFPTSDEERAALSLEQVMDGVGAGDDHAFDELRRSKMAHRMTAFQQLLRGECGYECFGCDDRFLGIPAFTSPNGGTYCASCAEDWTAASDAPQDG